jgi:hypothetical protein
MGKEILAAVFGSDEAEALRIVEPLHSACSHLEYPERTNKRGFPLPRAKIKTGGDERKVPQDCDTGPATALA